ncbi:hypothetical protein [Lysobacter capsici]|uniref:hypothetical protein n=1 Tax=Lysobacter capsici TaxID=435897 RepID=UPI003CCD17A3
MPQQTVEHAFAFARREAGGHRDGQVAGGLRFGQIAPIAGMTGMDLDRVALGRNETPAEFPQHALFARLRVGRRGERTGERHRERRDRDGADGSVQQANALHLRRTGGIGTQAAYGGAVKRALNAGAARFAATMSRSRKTRMMRWRASAMQADRAALRPSS